MKASELIVRLAQLIKEAGDEEVIVENNRGQIGYVVGASHSGVDSFLIETKDWKN